MLQQQIFRQPESWPDVRLGNHHTARCEIGDVEQECAENAGKGEGCGCLNGKIAKIGHLGFSCVLKLRFLVLALLALPEGGLSISGRGQIGAR